MKKSLRIGFILVFFLSACISSTTNKPPKVGVQQALEMTREYYAMQTIIALEQITRTPNSSIATALKSDSIIYQGPGINYRMACYVSKGTQLTITNRNADSTWLRVILGEKQTCAAMLGNNIRKDIIPDPTMQLWILHSSYTISGNLLGIPSITPTPTWFYSGGIVKTPTMEIPPLP